MRRQLNIANAAGLTPPASIRSFEDDLNRSIPQLWPHPQQTAQIRRRNAQFVRCLGDIHAMTAEDLDDNVGIKMLDGVVMSGRRPLIKDSFAVLRWSWVRSCLRPGCAGIR
jgi:hypothetical protein